MAKSFSVNILLTQWNAKRNIWKCYTDMICFKFTINISKYNSWNELYQFYKKNYINKIEVYIVKIQYLEALRSKHIETPFVLIGIKW